MSVEYTPVFYKNRTYGAQLIDLTIEEYESEEEPQLLFTFELCSEPGFVVTGTCDADRGAGSMARRWLSALGGYYHGMDFDELRCLIGSVAGIRIETMTVGAFTFYLIEDIVQSRDLELLVS